MTDPYVLSAKHDVCVAQTNPIPDLTLTLTLAPTLGGSWSALEVGRGSSAIHFSLMSLRANLNSLARTCNKMLVNPRTRRRSRPHASTVSVTAVQQ